MLTERHILCKNVATSRRFGVAFITLNLYAKIRNFVYIQWIEIYYFHIRNCSGAQLYINFSVSLSFSLSHSRLYLFKHRKLPHRLGLNTRGMTHGFSSCKKYANQFNVHYKFKYCLLSLEKNCGTALDIDIPSKSGVNHSCLSALLTQTWKAKRLLKTYTRSTFNYAFLLEKCQYRISIGINCWNCSRCDTDAQTMTWKSIDNWIN